jgi:hypothetical protein
MSRYRLRRGYFSQLLFASVLYLTVSPLAGGEPRLLQHPRVAGDLAHVEVLLEVGGDLKIADEGKIKPLKMSVVGKMVYDERLVAVVKDTGHLRSVRYYKLADAAIKIDKGGLKPHLRDERRLIAVATGEGVPTLFSPQGPLNREELELIDVPGNSLLVDELLPAHAVAVHDQWQHSDQLLAGLLGLDAVSQTDVRSELKEIDETSARVELSGTVQGAVAGVATEIELKGRYKYQFKQERITWLALLIEEKRSVGHVGPGADVVARLQMTIAPQAEAGPLSDAAIAGLPLEPAPPQTLLEYEPAARDFTIQHDRRWYVMSDKAGTLAMRLVDRGELIAQCNVSKLPNTDPGKHPTLARFQEDVEQSLDKQFKRFLQASEGTNSLGYTVYRVVAEGVAAELPIQWIYYFVADPHGHQVVFAFTLEEQFVPQLAEADEAIVKSLVIKDEG